MISYNKRSYETTGGIRGNRLIVFEEEINDDLVVGLDVSKGESEVQAFLDKKQPYKKSFKVAHTLLQRKSW